MYTISEVASRLNIMPHTLRYYESEGLIESIRTPQGTRRFTEEHVKWLQFVLKLRETEMPISKIKQYVALVKEGEHTSQQRLELLEDHQLYIQEQIKKLTDTSKLLNDKVSNYRAIVLGSQLNK